MLERAALLILGCLAIALATPGFKAAAPTSPDRVAPVIETFLRWAIEGRDLPADPPKPSPALPHRNCGGRFDREHLPETVYVSWQLSAEAQHAVCNWKYDLASHHASPLTQEEAAAVAGRISAGTVGPQERAFFHVVPKRDGRLAVTAGYCWGSAAGTFAFEAEGPVLIGELSIHGY
jgi:hypothetical protein